MSQVYGCPKCNNPFQVPGDAAGGTFECPSCRANIEIPHPAATTELPPINSMQNQGSEVFECPFCAGQFEIDRSAISTSVSCPHCDREVDIDEATAGSEPPIFETTAESDFGKSDKRKRRNPKKNEKNRDRNRSAASESDDAEPEQTGFEPLQVDHLLPPTFDVPDPVRFPTRRGSNEVILPDGDGGFQSVEANVVTMVHDGEVYRLKRLTPEQRHRRKLVHGGITIVVAIILIYLTMKTIGLFS